MRDAGVPPLLEVDIAEKTYSRGAERLRAVDKLGFALGQGEVTCLLGPSGCGKTTALRIVMGLDTAFAGHVRPAPGTLRLGAVFQEPRLLPWRSVEQNVRLVAPDLPPPALEALLGELGLGAWRSHRPGQLSGGMARRVAIARALAVEPDLLVLDEAFVSLDERNAEILRSVVFAAVARRGTTVLMVTHDIREAMLVGDVLLILGPQPTRVIETVRFTTPRGERNTAWIERERARLAAADHGFLRVE